MAKLNTKDIKTGGEGGTPKTLKPGNHVCKINNVHIEEFKFIPGSYNVILDLEGPDMGKDFEGFFIDKNNEKLGRHKGQVARVKASEWAYADGKTKSGIVIERDTEMLKFLKNFCTSLGAGDWLLDQDGKHDTIESLFKAFAKDKPFAGKELEFCICGKEYTNNKGYTDYELFLPKYTKAGAPFGKTKVLVFNEAEHIKKKKIDTVNEFNADDNSISGAASADFQLD